MNNFDLVSIGDITTDAFIRLKEPGAHCDIDHNNLELCMGFGDKVPYEFVEIVRAVGNAANAAVGASRLGLKTALVSNLGEDKNGAECIDVLKNENISCDYVVTHQGKETNYHFVLWFEDDRTILTKHNEYERKFPDIGEPKWVYMSSIGGGTETYHEEAIGYFEKHTSINVLFQPGTYQIAQGTDKLSRLYKRTYLVAVNKKEAKKILNTQSNDFGALLQGLAELGPKMVLITDGEKGAYFFDGTQKFFMPTFPDSKPPYERTGAGDAYTSTLVSMLSMGKSPTEALRYSAVNSMSVVQQVGAQKGLLTLSQIEEKLKNAPDNFTVKKIS